MNVKAKIIGNQIWTSEDISLSQLKNILSEKNEITNIKIPLKNDNKNWMVYNGACCCSYISYVDNKKSYLYNLHVAKLLCENLNDNENGWRLPSINDWFQLFKYIDNNHTFDYWSESIAQNLRSTYGWPNNGTNKIGFNATPNFKRNEDGTYYDQSFACWWGLNNAGIGKIFEGVRLYPEDVIATFGTENKTGLAIRLVRNFSEPRPEEGLIYV